MRFRELRTNVSFQKRHVAEVQDRIDDVVACSADLRLDLQDGTSEHSSLSTLANAGLYRQLRLRWTQIDGR